MVKILVPSCARRDSRGRLSPRVHCLISEHRPSIIYNNEFFSTQDS
jgi:hypothetical protein